MHNIQEISIAIDKSIEHWEENVKGPPFLVGPQDCALCHMFYWFYVDSENCYGCPIQIYAGADGCKFTPYEEAAAAANDFETSIIIGASNDLISLKEEAVYKAAKEELNFLLKVRDWFHKIKHLW